MKIENLKVYDLEESIVASGYPMQTETNQRKATVKDIKRAFKLTKLSNGNGAHGQWMTGALVSFDLTFSNKAWIEAERYIFLNFVSSQSTMHRITKFNLSDQYNEYVDPRCIQVMEEKQAQYNKIVEELEKVPEENSYERNRLNRLKNHKYLELLYSNPAGFELTARVTTNYRCLLNMYIQRHDHRLPEWREFCKFLYDRLPLFAWLVKMYNQGELKEEDLPEQI